MRAEDIIVNGIITADLPGDVCHTGPFVKDPVFTDEKLTLQVYLLCSWPHSEYGLGQGLELTLSNPWFSSSIGNTMVSRGQL